MVSRLPLALGIFLLPVLCKAEVPAVNIKISTNLQARAQSPSPPASAKQKKHIGKGQTAFGTANSSDDGDPLWTERLDINGDGSTEDVELLYDDEDKVLYAYAKVSCDCTSGGRSKGGLLFAVYGKGNTYGKPPGSGWWVAALDIGECGSKSAGLYGVKFEAKGKVVESGMAVLDAEHDDIVIAIARK
jgi:hypothetical protein